MLPAMTRYEQPGGGTSTSTERMVYFSPEIEGPRVAEARAEWQIYADLAARIKPAEWQHVSFETAEEIRSEIETSFPGSPGGGGSDYASFVAVGAPAFSLSSKSWSYGNYTWHTNRDTYDKIVFDDVRNNAILTAILVYMACEEPQKTSREKAVLPINSRTGKQAEWPTQRKANRKGN